MIYNLYLTCLYLNLMEKIIYKPITQKHHILYLHSYLYRYIAADEDIHLCVYSHGFALLSNVLQSQLKDSLPL